MFNCSILKAATCSDVILSIYWQPSFFCRLTTRLEDLHDAIEDYWEKEEHKLQEFMKLREFHEEFKSVSCQHFKPK